MSKDALTGVFDKADRRTEGALNGKFSGRLRVKWNVPPLYGLLD